MYKKLIVWILLISILMLAFLIYISKDSDSENIKLIYREFESKYTTTFKYIKKSKNPETGVTNYYFKCVENEDLLVEAYIGNSRDALVPFAPLDQYVADNFSDVLRQYIIDKECGGSLDIISLSIEEATQTVYDIMRRLKEQMALYYKKNIYYNDDLDIIVFYKGGKKKMNFYKLNKDVIWDQLLMEAYR